MVLQAMAVLEQKKALFVYGLGGHGVGGAFVAGVGHEQPVFEQGFRFDISAGVGKRQKHAIGPAVIERFARRPARFLSKIEFQIRPVTPQAREDARQQKRRNRRDHAHPQIARKRLAGGADHVSQFFGFAQHAACLARDSVTETGEPHNPAVALDQSHADERFEFAQASG